MATYGEVKADFIALFNRRDMTAAQAETFLQNSIRRIQRIMRVPGQETSVTITIDALDENGVLIPSDFLEMIRIENSDGDALDLRDLRVVKQYAETSGKPVVYARQVNKWVFGPAPEADDTLRVDYYKEFGEVEEDSDENLLTVFAPDLLMYSALIYGGRHFRDKRLPDFENTFKMLMDEIEDMSKRDELAGGAVVSHAYSFPADQCY
jgi:hypothetical protein